MDFVTLIPAAGAGTRMRPLTNTVPKAMIQVAGQPILYHIVKKAVDAGGRNIVIIVEYLAEAITEKLPGLFPGINFEFIHQGPMQGLGHAIYKARPQCDGKPVLIIYGDTLFEAELEPVLTKKEPQIGVYRVEDPRRFGIIEVDANEKITKFVEKPDNPTTDMALPGVNFFPDASPLFAALEHIINNEIKTKGEYQVTDAYDKMIASGTSMGYFLLDAWYDCGKHAETLETNRALLESSGSQIFGEVADDCDISDPVYIGPGSKISGGRIGPFTAIGPNCHISGSNLENSIVGEGNTLQDTKLRSSMIGNECRIRDLDADKVVLGDYSLVNSQQD